MSAGAFAIGSTVLTTVWIFGGVATLNQMFKSRHFPVLAARFLLPTSVALVVFSAVGLLDCFKRWALATNDANTFASIELVQLPLLIIPLFCIMARLLAFAATSKVITLLKPKRLRLFCLNLDTRNPP